MRKFFRSIIEKGIKKDDDIEIRQHVGLINVSALLCYFMLSVFITLNIIQHKWILLVPNAVLILLITGALFARRSKYVNAIIVAQSFLFSIYFFSTALLFRNGLDFAIIIMMAVSVLLINNRRARRAMLLVQICLFSAFMYYQKIPAVIPPLPSYRNYLTVILLLFIFACVLEYFKNKQLHYTNELNKANEQLRESNRVKERMLSILSHDFNAPVSSLVTTLTMFDSDILTEAEFRDISVKLKAQLQVLTISLADVLHWSKMQIGGDAGQADNINITQLMQEDILPLFQHSMQEKNIILQNNTGNTVYAHANRDHLKLIFRNLLSNAIKFSFAGGTINIDAKADNHTVAVSIKDEGAGIPPHVLDALKNEQLAFTSSPGTAKERGTGLGLMLVRQFLHKNSGTLTIQSVQGKGSTFSITLPAK